MSILSAYTLEEAREQLRLWKDCERALSSGQAKAYRIGSREYTAFDLDEIAGRIRHFANVIAGLTGAVRTSSVVRVVPRDL